MVSEAEALRLVEEVVPAAPHRGFEQRHSELVNSVRDQLLGSLAILGQDDETNPKVLANRLNWARRENAGALTLFSAVKGLDNYLHNEQWLYEGERHEEHQSAALYDVLSGLSSGHKEGYIESPTSTGKTMEIAKLAEAFEAAGLRVLILAPTKTIAEQDLGEQRDKGLYKHARSLDKQKVGRHFGDKRAKKDNRVVVSTYQSFNNFARDNSIGEFDVILADEGHRGLGEITSYNLRHSSPHAVKICLTATTTFGLNKSVDQVFPHPYHRLSLREAIESDIVAPVQCLILETGTEIKIRDPLRYDFSERELGRLINVKSRNQKALQLTKDFVQAGRQGIIACLPGSELAHAKLMANQLGTIEIEDAEGNKRPIIAKAIGAFMSDKQRGEVLAAYERGEIDVLTFVDVLKEGWDTDRASFLINTCPTTSLVKITQQIGRTLRKKDMHSIIVDFVDEVVGKEQKTALQVLGEEEINLRKIHGNSPYLGGNRGDTYLRGILSPDLYGELMANEGRLITDLTIPARERQHWSRARYEYWERKLAKEGMPAEPRDILGVPDKLINGLEIFEHDFFQEHDRSPTVDETETALRDAGVIGWKYGLADIKGAMISRSMKRTTFDDEYFHPLTFDEEETGEIALTALLPHEIEKTLGALDERERQILALRFGLDRNGEVRSLEEVGVIFNLTRERIRAIESGAMSKLRHPARSTLTVDDRPKPGSLNYRPAKPPKNFKTWGDYQDSVRKRPTIWDAKEIAGNSLLRTIDLHRIYDFADSKEQLIDRLSYDAKLAVKTIHESWDFNLDLHRIDAAIELIFTSDSFFHGKWGLKTKAIDAIRHHLESSRWDLFGEITRTLWDEKGTERSIIYNLVEGRVIDYIKRNLSAINIRQL